MLVLQRRKEEAVTIDLNGERVVVKVTKVEGGKCWIGFTASKSVTIHRNEVQAIIDAGKVKVSA